MSLNIVGSRMSKSSFYTLASLLLLTGSLAAQTTVFTYQGRLSAAGAPANGNFDLEFRLFDALNGGTQLGAVVTRTNVVVADGVFSVTLDFGANFPGAGRFLEIGVRQSGPGAFTLLAPRQPVTSSPYSIQTINAQMLGGFPAGQYLQTNGSGAGLTDLNASSITSGTLSNARLGQIPSANIADSAVTSSKIAPGQVVKSINTLKDDVTLAAGNNITITPSGSTLTIAATGGAGGVTGSGTVGTVPLWSAGTAVGNSLITQSAGEVNMPSVVRFAPAVSGFQTNVGTPNSTTGITFSGPGARSDIRYDGTLTIVNGPGGVQGPANGISINTAGNVSVGASPTGFGRLEAHSTGVQQTAGYARSTGADSIGFWGDSRGSGINSVGVHGTSLNGTGVFGHTDGIFDFSSGFGAGVFGRSVRADGVGVHGRGDLGVGVWGSSASSIAVYGFTGTGVGVYGDTASTDSELPGVLGVSIGTGGVGVRGEGTTGVLGTSTSGTGVTGQSSSGNGVFGSSVSGYAGNFAGRVRVTILGTNGINPLCSNLSNEIAACSSSIRYKSGVEPLRQGLKLVSRLRPVTFDWNATGQSDIGLIAEEVAVADPRLAFRNEKGEIEGIRFNSLIAVLVNAVKHQETQIDSLKDEIRSLRRKLKQSRQSDALRRNTQRRR